MREKVVVAEGGPGLRAIRKTLLVVLVVLALPACGSGAGETSAKGGPESEVGFTQGGSDARAGVSQPGGEELAAAGAAISDDLSTPAGFDRKIVKSAELGIRAEHVRDTAASAQQIAADFGGSVLSSRIGSDGPVSADLVLLVPSPEFEAALGELRGLGKKVTTDTVTGEDVTEEFVDLEAQERNLLAAEQSLLELYERAQSVNAALSIERELTIIRGEIEQVQGRIQYLEDRTASSRISLSIEPVPPPAPPAWSPARVVAQSWEASLAVLQVLATAVISALVFGWWLAPALVLALVLWRRHVRRPAAAGSSEAG